MLCRTALVGMGGADDRELQVVLTSRKMIETAVLRSGTVWSAREMTGCAELDIARRGELAPPGREGL